MPKTVDTVGQKRLPYRTVVANPNAIKYPMIEERKDFQFAENGNIEIVSLGTFDLVKEVDSHKDEVGLINALRLAEARGLGIDSFVKQDNGFDVDIPEIDTFDDLIKARESADAKLAAIAKDYGLTPDQLVNVVKLGQFDKLQKPVIEDNQSEGGQE